MNAPCVLRKIKTLDSSCVVCDSSSLGILTTFQIVDSIMALFRTDYSGRGELSERQQKVRPCLHDCALSNRALFGKQLAQVSRSYVHMNTNTHCCFLDVIQTEQTVRGV